MKIDYIDPNNYGIVHTILDEKQQELCWTLIKGNSPSSARWNGNKLLGVDTQYKQWLITEGYQLFEHQILMPLVNAYMSRYGLPGKIETTHRHMLKFNRFWCRASTRHDYHALHDHRSIMTFICWLHNPIDSEKERMDQYGFRPEAGEVILTYSDTCGKLRKHHFPLSPEKNGTMIVFPSDINHMAQPIHSTDEYRICLAGDLAYDSYNITGAEGLLVT